MRRQATQRRQARGYPGRGLSSPRPGVLRGFLDAEAHQPTPGADHLQPRTARPAGPSMRSSRFSPHRTRTRQTAKANTPARALRDAPASRFRSSSSRARAPRRPTRPQAAVPKSPCPKQRRHQQAWGYPGLGLSSPPLEGASSTFLDIEAHQLAPAPTARSGAPAAPAGRCAVQPIQPHTGQGTRQTAAASPGPLCAAPQSADPLLDPRARASRRPARPRPRSARPARTGPHTGPLRRLVSAPAAPGVCGVAIKLSCSQRCVAVGASAQPRVWGQTQWPGGGVVPRIADKLREPG